MATFGLGRMDNSASRLKASPCVNSIERLARIEPASPANANPFTHPSNRLQEESLRTPIEPRQRQRRQRTGEAFIASFVRNPRRLAALIFKAPKNEFARLGDRQ